MSPVSARSSRIPFKALRRFLENLDELRHLLTGASPQRFHELLNEVLESLLPVLVDILGERAHRVTHRWPHLLRERLS